MIPEQAVRAAAEAWLSTVPTGDGTYNERAARAALEAAAPYLLATQHVTETQLRESNTARQERIWALEAELWQMYARENKERLRLLERNRRLEAKIVHRAHVIGALRHANRRMLAQLIGSGQRVPE